MGFAVAAEAARRGADVTLVAGPATVEPPTVAELVRVRGAVQMRDAVVARAADADIIVMAAAVADYAPEAVESGKIKKQGETLTLTLRRTPDILASLGQWRSRLGEARPVLVGFAAETSDLVASARQKLEAKRVDLIVANDVLQPGAGFEADTNVVTLVGRDWDEALPLQPKSSVASAILDRVERMLEAAPPARRGRTAEA